MYRMEYYPAIKRSEILLHVVTSTNLENMPAERSPSQGTTYCMIPFIQNFQNKQALLLSGAGEEGRSEG